MGAREADRSDLTLEVFRGGRNDVSLDGEGAVRDVLACLPQSTQVLGVYREVVDGDVVGGFGRVCPSEDGVGGSVQDVLGVGPCQIGGERDVEGMVDDGVAYLWWSYRGSALGSDLVVRMESLHRHGQIWSRRHAKGGTHPL